MGFEDFVSMVYALATYEIQAKCLKNNTLYKSTSELLNCEPVKIWTVNEWNTEVLT